MHACRGAIDGRQERDAVIVSVVVAVFVQFPISGFVEWGIRCVRVRKSAVKVGVSCATSDSVVGDAQIKDKVTRACRVGEVADDFADSLARLVPGFIRTLMDFEYRFCGGAAFTKEPCMFGSVYVLKEPSWHKEPFAIPTGTNSLGTTFVPRASESPSPRLPCGLNFELARTSCLNMEPVQLDLVWSRVVRPARWIKL